MSVKFTPDYRDIDYKTMVARLKTLLSKLDSFKDYNFEGSNISMLIELVSYVGDLNTYFTNKLAQNLHPETANVYEIVHSLVKQQGHNPVGYVASELTVTIRVYRVALDKFEAVYNANDQIFIPQWSIIDTGIKDDVNGDNIYYTLTDSYNYTVTDDDVTNGYIEFDVVLKQGVPVTSPLTYTGSDIVDNQIILPFKQYDMGTHPYDFYTPSIDVRVGTGQDKWVRINDFFDGISGLLGENNAYMFSYDKYRRYVINFSNTRNIPDVSDSILVYPIETLGSLGAVTANTFSVDRDSVATHYIQDRGIRPETTDILGIETPFMTNLRTSTVIPVDNYVIYNVSGSSGGSDPQTIDDLKISGSSAAQNQQRNCTRYDYKGNLESRGDVIVANAWGEQEANPGALYLENYNKAYISVIPAEWSNGVANNVTLKQLSGSDIDAYFTGGVNVTLDFPLSYNPVWVNDILSYIEPRKMIGIYEIFVTPEVVKFRIDFGLKIKRTYNWIEVKETVLRKLEYYFSPDNREFGEVIDFREIINYLLDPSVASNTDDFMLVRGIDSLVIRDIMIHRDPELVERLNVQNVCNFMGGNMIGQCSNTNFSDEASCNAAGEAWSLVCSLVPDSMYIYPENELSYFPHYIDLGYTHSTNDETYNDLLPIQLGYKQFPQLVKDLCVFVNEG